MKRNVETQQYEIIGRNLRELRLSRGYSLSDLAKILGVSYQQVQKFEKGINRISLKAIHQLKQLYGVPYEAFFDGLPPASETEENICVFTASVPSDSQALRQRWVSLGAKLNRVKDSKLRRNIVHAAEIILS